MFRYVSDCLWVMSFIFHKPKPEITLRHYEGNLNPKPLDTGRKFSWGDAYLGGGGLRPLILPAAHLPSGHLGFWGSAGNTVFKQLPSCLSRYETSNRWSCSNHVADAPLPPSLFSCLPPLTVNPVSKRETNKCAFAFFRWGECKFASFIWATGHTALVNLLCATVMHRRPEDFCQVLFLKCLNALWDWNTQWL